MFTFIGNSVKILTVSTVAVHTYLYIADKPQFDKLTKYYIKCPPIKKTKKTIVKHLKLIPELTRSK